MVAIVLICNLSTSFNAINVVWADEQPPFVIYLDIRNDKAFAENGVGIYAYDSAKERESSVPIKMKPSDKGEGIYEYTLEKQWKYIAFIVATSYFQFP